MASWHRWCWCWCVGWLEAWCDVDVAMTSQPMRRRHEVRRTEAGGRMVELSIPAGVGGADEEGREGVRDSDQQTGGSGS